MILWKKIKKTLTISSDLKKKINTTFISSSNKKSFSVEKKKPIRSNKSFKRNSQNLSQNVGQNIKKRTSLENLLSSKQLKILLIRTINQRVKVN